MLSCDKSGLFQFHKFFCTETSLWSLLNSFCLAFPFSGSCVPMNYNEEGRNERERVREGRPRPEPEPRGQRETNHPGLDISSRTVSECQPSGRDGQYIFQSNWLYTCTGIIYFQIIIADLEAEIRDSFESEGLTETRVTPKLRRRPRHGFWRSFSRDSCDEMNSSFSSHDNETGSTSGSNKSSRRSSIVSMIQRRMSRGETRFKN